MSEKFKFAKAYPSDHLRAPDLEDKEATLTVKAWEYPNSKQDTGGDGQVMKGTVLIFKESPKRFVANVTNYQSIKAIYGKDPDKWIGKKITLRPDKTRFGKETLPCIRVANINPETGEKPSAW